FKKVSDIVKSGEKILVVRPHNENIVIISEKEYHELIKAARQNAVPAAQNGRQAIHSKEG
ncbi:MAG: hypothetical protein FWD16_05695, partial [Clostridia bacterium]|nr:hypothetical protein [Clostridia bacterium]